MKINRLKKSHKALNFYIQNFQYREPFQIIVDATFCQAAIQNKVIVDEQLRKYLQSDLKLLTTQCIILESESLGPILQGATSIVKKFYVHKCGHEGKPVSGAECIKHMSKQSRYIIATQDRNLQNALRKVPGRALIYLHRAAPVLDQPSEASKKLVKNAQQKAVEKNVEKSLEQVKKAIEIAAKEAEKAPKIKKKIKNPNPLSCKKKKPKVVQTLQKKVSETSKNIEKPKRKRVKVPKHVKMALNK